MEELELSLKLPVLVSPNSTVCAHGYNVLEQWIDRDALHHFLMPVECLQLAELSLRCTP